MKPLNYAKELTKVIAKRPKTRWPVFGQGPDSDLDRTKFMTASEANNCPRRIKFGKLFPTTHDGEYWGFFERGHNVESWFVSLLPGDIRDNFNLQFTGKNQVSFFDGQQSGTPDGVFFHNTDPTFLTLEIKSIDPRVRTLPKAGHNEQVVQNTDLIATMTGLTPLGGELVYIDASDYTKITPFHIPFDMELAEKLEAKAQTVMGAASAEDLPPEGIFNDGCKYCEFGGRCSAIEGEKIKSKLGDTQNDFFP